MVAYSYLETETAMKKKSEKVDDLLNDSVREVCKELTRLIKDGIVKRIAEENSKPEYGVAVSVLLTNAQGHLLLARRKNNSGAGLMSTPGGRVEYNETVLQAAYREFEEETGATLLSTRMLGWRKHNRFDKHYIMFYVHATAYTGTITNCIPDKSEDWKFYNLLLLDWTQSTEPEDILAEVFRATKKERIGRL